MLADQPLRLCISCRFFRLEKGVDPRFAHCGHPTSIDETFSMVTGEKKTSSRTCWLARAVGDCGKDGKFWEAV
jgi:hypothetical protein